MSQYDSEFWDWLRTQVEDLDCAKEFVKAWYRNGQPGYIEGHGLVDKEYGFTMRAMAYHVSMALEGKDISDDESWLTWYIDTKYGPTLYWAMCS